jgi:hypothetical protein
MSHVDHVTLEVPHRAFLQDRGDQAVLRDEFFSILGFKKVEPDRKVEGDYKVSWFEDQEGFQVHLVEAKEDDGAAEICDRGLEHFCVILSPPDYHYAVQSRFVTRNNPESPRFWMEGPWGLRAEVRESTNVTTGLIDFNDPLPDPVREQQKVMDEALTLYRERNVKYKDNWKRFGWRGLLFRIRERAERAWDLLWDEDVGMLPTEERTVGVDDLLDLINFAAFAIRAIRDGNRDGEGKWW